MHVDLHIYELFSVKKGLDASAKSIDSDQPAQSAQSDLGRNFSLSVIFQHVKGPVYPMDQLAV